MAAVHTCTLPQPRAMYFAASRHVLMPPIPDSDTSAVSGSRAISATMCSPIGWMAGPA